MNVTVERVDIPAMSTIGYGTGTDDGGRRVRFAGDHRMMYAIAEVIEAADSRDELPVADVPLSAVLVIEELRP